MSIQQNGSKFSARKLEKKTLDPRVKIRYRIVLPIGSTKPKWSFRPSSRPNEPDPQVLQKLHLCEQALGTSFPFLLERPQCSEKCLNTSAFLKLAISRVHESKTLDSSFFKPPIPKIAIWVWPFSLAPSTYNHRLGLTASTSRYSRLHKFSC
jgi:hypothetical protein